jgi:hypothetical protein
VVADADPEAVGAVGDGGVVDGAGGDELFLTTSLTAAASSFVATDTAWEIPSRCRRAVSQPSWVTLQSNAYTSHVTVSLPKQ